MLAAFDSPGPLTMQPITASVSSSTPSYSLLPLRHFVADVALNALGEFLKRGAGGAAAAGAGRHAGRERAQAERLQQFAGGVDFLAAVAAGPRRERNANRVADAFVEQNSHRRGGPDESLGAHARFGEAEVQRLLGLLGEVAIDGDQIAGAWKLCRK